VGVGAVPPARSSTEADRITRPKTLTDTDRDRKEVIGVPPGGSGEAGVVQLHPDVITLSGGVSIPVEGGSDDPREGSHDVKTLISVTTSTAVKVEAGMIRRTSVSN
jgi:hypothetical protein